MECAYVIIYGIQGTHNRQMDRINCTKQLMVIHSVEEMNNFTACRTARTALYRDERGDRSKRQSFPIAYFYLIL